jgi:hypothetical protein
MKLKDKDNSTIIGWSIDDDIIIGAMGTLYVKGGFMSQYSEILNLEALLEHQSLPKGCKIGEWLRNNKPAVFAKVKFHE